MHLGSNVKHLHYCKSLLEAPDQVKKPSSKPEEVKPTFEIPLGITFI